MVNNRDMQQLKFHWNKPDRIKIKNDFPMQLLFTGIIEERME